MVGGVLFIATHSGMKRTGTQKCQEIMYGDISYGDETYGDVTYGDVLFLYHKKRAKHVKSKWYEK